MIGRKIRVATMNEKAIGYFSWARWTATIELLCHLGEMCGEETFGTFKRRIGCEEVGHPDAGIVTELERSGLLVERAALAGVSADELWHRRSPISLGGACRMMFTADGVVAVNLPREDDWQLLPAFFGMSGRIIGQFIADTEPTWEKVEEAISQLPTVQVVSAAGELGMAIAEVGSYQGANSATNSIASLSQDHLAPCSHSHRPLSEAKVVDLSAMWAGPLCGDLLARAGAQVVKVESLSRPDGAKRGMPEFYERLNIQKQHLSIRLETSEGLGKLQELLQEAHIVITSCRPRALEQMGIDLHRLVSENGVICAAITGYGWEQGHRVAFGDDAAAAGGLVAFGDADVASHGSESVHGSESASVPKGEATDLLPCFVGDALADPLTGVVATVAVMKQWLSTSSAFLDLSMAGSATYFCEGGS